MRPIDADKLLYDLSTASYPQDVDIGKAYRIFKKELENAPTLSPWIPVTEELPKKEGEYICTSRWDNKLNFTTKQLDFSKASERAKKAFKDRLFGEYCFGDYWSDGIDNVEEVIAWMPLPEPYKDA